MSVPCVPSASRAGTSARAFVAGSVPAVAGSACAGAGGFVDGADVRQKALGPRRGGIALQLKAYICLRVLLIKDGLLRASRTA